MSIRQGLKPSCNILDVDTAATVPFVAQWKALSEKAWVPNPFWDPDFCLTALKELQVIGVKFAAVIDDSEKLIALAPFKIARAAKFGPKVAELWTHDYIPIGTPLIEQGNTKAFAMLIDGIIAETGAPVLAKDVKLLAEITPGIQQGAEIDIIDRYERAILNSAKTGPDYRRHVLSKQRRQGMARRFRRLEDQTVELGPLKIDLCNEPQHIPSEFESFLDIEAAGWKGKRATALASDKQHAAFSRIATRKLAERGHCQIATLKAGDTALAALILFEMNGEFFSWKIAFNETYRAHSPGAHILSHFADPLMAAGGAFKLDSCATEDNKLANALWAERAEMSTILISKPSQAIAATFIKKSIQLEKAMHSAAKALLKR